MCVVFAIFVVYAVSGLIEDMFIILQQDVDTRLLVRSFFFFFLTWYILLVMDVLKYNSLNYGRKQIIRIHVKDMMHNYIHLFAWFNNFFFIINPIWESCFISDVLIFPEQDFGFFFYLSSSSGQNSSKKRSNLI